jgi:hypothetical protein
VYLVGFHYKEYQDARSAKQKIRNHCLYILHGCQSNQKINKRSSMQLCCSKTSQLFLINICPLGRKKDERKKETTKQRTEEEEN